MIAYLYVGFFFLFHFLFICRGFFKGGLVLVGVLFVCFTARAVLSFVLLLL